MSDSKVKIDYEKMTATVNIADPKPKVLLISKGQARYIELPEHGELVVKTHDGKINRFCINESHLF